LSEAAEETAATVSAATVSREQRNVYYETVKRKRTVLRNYKKNVEDGLMRAGTIERHSLFATGELNICCACFVFSAGLMPILIFLFLQSGTSYKKHARLTNSILKNNTSSGVKMPKLPSLKRGFECHWRGSQRTVPEHRSTPIKHTELGLIYLECMAKKLCMNMMLARGLRLLLMINKYATLSNLLYYFTLHYLLSYVFHAFSLAVLYHQSLSRYM
jgi:hypothetical protein